MKSGFHSRQQRNRIVPQPLQFSGIRQLQIGRFSSAHIAELSAAVRGNIGWNAELVALLEKLPVAVQTGGIKSHSEGNRYTTYFEVPRGLRRNHQSRLDLWDGIDLARAGQTSRVAKCDLGPYRLADLVCRCTDGIAGGASFYDVLARDGSAMVPLPAALRRMPVQAESLQYRALAASLDSLLTYYQDDCDAAIKLSRNSLQMARKSGDKQIEVHMLAIQSLSHLRIGAVQKALKLADELAQLLAGFRSADPAYREAFVPSPRLQIRPSRGLAFAPLPRNLTAPVGNSTTATGHGGRASSAVDYAATAVSSKTTLNP